MKRAGRQVLGLLCLLILWELVARAGWLNPLYAPAPHRVGQVLLDLLSQGTIWPHVQATFSAALWGLILGVTTGVILGLLVSLIPPLADLLEPVMLLLNAIPRVILAPLFVIWFGIGLGSKVALAFILVAVLFFFAVHSGIRDVPANLVERVRTLGGGRLALIREVYVPFVTSRMLGQLKVAVGFAFTGAVVGEFVASSRGLGYQLAFAQSTYNAALTLALIAVIMGFVLLLFALFNRLEQGLLLWKRPDGGDHRDGAPRAPGSGQGA